jgi:recombinational DNA repair ATPase RecF
MAFQIVGINIENLRGFFTTYFETNRKLTFIVGPNNSGKTSLIRLIDYFLNDCSFDVLEGNRVPSDQELSFLLPARDARHKARRFSLHISVSDRRSHHRYNCFDGIAILRFNIRLSPSPHIYVALGCLIRVI